VIKNQLMIVMYHYVREIKNSRYPNIKGLEKDDFIEQIDFLAEKYNIVTMEQVIDAVNGKSELVDNAVLLTFDDGYIDHYVNAFPILAARNVQGSFFIPSESVVEHKLLNVNKIHFILASGQINEIVKDIFIYLDEYRLQGYDIEANEILFNRLAVASRFDDKETIFVKRLLQHALDEKLSSLIASKLFAKYVKIDEKIFAKELYLNLEQIRHMKQAGMYIGMHGHGHYWLGKIKDTDMKKDISQGYEHLKEFMNEKYLVMNYPYGSYNEKTIEYVKDIGCKIGLGTEVGIVNIKDDNLFTYKRLDTNDLPPKSNKYLEYEEINDKNEI